jgi:hypothetical protein
MAVTGVVGLLLGVTSVGPSTANALTLPGSTPVPGHPGWCFAPSPIIIPIVPYPCDPPRSGGSGGSGGSGSTTTPGSSPGSSQPGVCVAPNPLFPTVPIPVIPVPCNPGPGGPVGTALSKCSPDSGGGVPTSISDAVNAAFKTLVDCSVALPTGALKWFTQIPPAATDGTTQKVKDVASAIALALLGLVLTILVLRLWLMGVGSDRAGGTPPIDAVMRTFFAALCVVAWPWVAQQCVQLANDASGAVFGSITAQDLASADLGLQLNLLLGGGIGILLGIVIAIVGILVLIELLIFKVVLSATTIFLVAAMPIAIVLWPIEEFAWLSKTAMKTFVACLIVPLVWALLIVTAIALAGSILQKDLLQTLSNPDQYLNQLLNAVVTLGLLIAMTKIPRGILRAANGFSGGGGRGLLGGLAAYKALQFGMSAVGGKLGGGAASGLRVTRDGLTGEIKGSPTVTQTLRPGSRKAGAALQEASAKQWRDYSEKQWQDYSEKDAKWRDDYAKWQFDQATSVPAEQGTVDRMRMALRRQQLKAPPAVEQVQGAWNTLSHSERASLRKDLQRGDSHAQTTLAKWAAAAGGQAGTYGMSEVYQTLGAAKPDDLRTVAAPRYGPEPPPEPRTAAPPIRLGPSSNGEDPGN